MGVWWRGGGVGLLVAVVEAGLPPSEALDDFVHLVVVNFWVLDKAVDKKLSAIVELQGCFFF